MSRSEETKRKSRKLSEEHKQKIRDSIKGKKHSEETKNKISKSLIGKSKKGTPSKFKGVARSDEIKRKISESKKGHIVTDETRKKISKSNKGKVRTEEFKEKLRNRKPTEEQNKKNRESHLGQIPWNKGITGLVKSEETKRKISEAKKGKKCYDETKKKISEANKGNFHTEESKKKISDNTKGEKNGFYGRKHSDESRKKMRLSRIRNMEIDFFLGNQVTPGYNLNGCEYFEKLMLETNTYIQHAQNGGEFFINELGYWVDGYDEKNNIVYEYDEKSHYNLDGTLKEKDINRQKEIENYLKCKFIRIKHDENFISNRGQIT